jgi:protoporphyrinogen oxidase
VNPKAKEVCFANGVVAPYEYLISSVPLPDFIPMISGTPNDVLEAAKKLACTTLVLVNLGIDREDISEASWSYFYEDEYVFSRVSFPHIMSPHTVPPGAGSIQSEVYFSNKYRPLDRSAADYIEPVIAGLKRCGLIREEDKILFRDGRVIPYGNIIFDLDRFSSLKVVHGYLDSLGIGYCGRYGEWGYLWTDESFVSGENAAQKILDRMSSG